MLRLLAVVIPLLLSPLLAACGSTPSVPKEQQLPSYSVEPYAEVLDAAVVDGMVDYPAIDEGLEQKLDVYLDALSRFGPTETPGLFPTEDDELAYYLNAYNAIMLKLWLNKGARTADADEGVNWLTWFTLPRWQVDGRSMTLDHLEQDLIRPEYEGSADPRRAGLRGRRLPAAAG